jgi:hypothetical protein
MNQCASRSKRSATTHANPADQQPQEARREAEWRGQRGAHQRPGPGDRGEVVSNFAAMNAL